MNNPWSEFEESEFMIHPDDVLAVNAHNASSDRKYQFLFHLAPEPWIGNVDSPLVILYANPGATELDLTGKPQFKAQEIKKLARINLRQEPSLFPHFFFSPELVGTQGQNWYFKTFKDLLLHASPLEISNKVLTCEMAPYHSKNWRQPKTEIPTQAYTNLLVEKAMKRKSLILIHRGSNFWLNEVKGLKDYPLAFKPNSSQSPYVSAGNYPKIFDDILEIIKGK